MDLNYYNKSLNYFNAAPVAGVISSVIPTSGSIIKVGHLVCFSGVTHKTYVRYGTVVVSFINQDYGNFFGLCCQSPDYVFTADGVTALELVLNNIGGAFDYYANFTYGEY